MTHAGLAPAAPAGFWHRTAAYSLDFALLGTLATALSWSRLRAGWLAVDDSSRALAQIMRGKVDAVVSTGAIDVNSMSVQLLRDPTVAAGAATLQAGILALLSAWLLAYALLATLYHVGFERSRWRASPGKHALRLSVVVAHSDTMPTPMQTFVRHAGGALSWLTLNLGHALAAVPPDKRALHDYLAGTRVVTSDANARLPAWARAWLWLQLLALVAIPAWLMLRAVASLRASL